MHSLAALELIILVQNTRSVLFLSRLLFPPHWKKGYFLRRKQRKEWFGILFLRSLSVIPPLLFAKGVGGKSSFTNCRKGKKMTDQTLRRVSNGFVLTQCMNPPSENHWHLVFREMVWNHLLVSFLEILLSPTEMALASPPPPRPLLSLAYCCYYDQSINLHTETFRIGFVVVVNLQ